MTETEEKELSLEGQEYNNRQRLFIRYVVAILVDLSVLSLFNEFAPEFLFIDSFSLSFFAAVILQVLLQLTLKAEHKVAEYFFKGKSGLKINILRGVTAWSMIFISKLVMLKAISIVFGKSVVFGGPVHGVVAFIVIITTMIIAEQVLVKIYNKLG